MTLPSAPSSSAPTHLPGPVRYHIELLSPSEHLLEVSMHVVTTPNSQVRLVLPAWSPGSYLIREYAKHLRHAQAYGPGGKPLGTTKQDKHSFVVELDGAGEMIFKYVLYGHDRSSRTNFVGETEAFLHGPATFFYLDRATHLPCQVRWPLPPGWTLHTALPLATEATEGEWLSAPSYDALIDAPLLAGADIDRATFDVDGRRHEVVVSGPCDGANRAEATARLAAHSRAIVTQAKQLFGDAELPYRRYVFLLRLAAGAVYGGLEHEESAALVASPYSFAPPADIVTDVERDKAASAPDSASTTPHEPYDDLLELFCHEHFHAWNGKRLRPSALGPFDYEREAYTRSLWVVEGITSYYDRLLLVRAGLLSPERYLEKLASDLERLDRIPAAATHSLETSSFDAWIKFYRPDEDTPNQTVSYYLLGSLVALLFDLEIRKRSSGTRSLDDVMRYLWRWQLRSQRGYPDEDVQPLFEAAVELPLGDLFDAHVRGSEPLRLAPVLSSFGVSLAPKPGQDRRPAELGIDTRDGGGGRCVVRHVLAGGPASRAGISAGDELIALDGFRIDERTLKERLSRRAAGTRVQLSYFRQDLLRSVEVTLSAPSPGVRALLDPEASPEARERRRAWIGG